MPEHSPYGGWPAGGEIGDYHYHGDDGGGGGGVLYDNFGDGKLVNRRQTPYGGWPAGGEVVDYHHLDKDSGNSHGDGGRISYDNIGNHW